jgi:hypothetical protein
MLIPYDPFREWDRSGPEPEPLIGECHYATEVAQMLHCESLDDLSAALDRAMQVCEQAGLAVPVHFRQVFRGDGQALQRDLRLSGPGLIPSHHQRWYRAPGRSAGATAVFLPKVTH